jgi:hypothetical protein
MVPVTREVIFQLWKGVLSISIGIKTKPKIVTSSKREVRRVR